MVDSLQGKQVEKKIDTGVMLVTKDNLESPEVKMLLHPPLDQYLK
jgi:ABC-type sugar transport system substrate-binding protein